MRAIWWVEYLNLTHFTTVATNLSVQEVNKVEAANCPEAQKKAWGHQIFWFAQGSPSNWILTWNVLTSKGWQLTQIFQHSVKAKLQIPTGYIQTADWPVVTPALHTKDRAAWGGAGRKR